MALIDEIAQATRCRHDDFDTARHGANLRELGDAAENHRAADRQMATIGLDRFLNLHGQLAGRAEDQDAGRLRRRTELLLHQTLQGRQGESSGLAGAGLGESQEIAAGEQMRNGLCLDRRRRGVIFLSQRLRQRRNQTEVGKSGHNQNSPYRGGPANRYRLDILRRETARDASTGAGQCGRLYDPEARMRGITRFVDGSQDATPVKIHAFSSTCHTRRLRAVRRNDKVVYLLLRNKSSRMRDWTSPRADGTTIPTPARASVRPFSRSRSSEPSLLPSRHGTRFLPGHW